jgi:hypothetical protein
VYRETEYPRLKTSTGDCLKPESFSVDIDLKRRNLDRYTGLGGHADDDVPAGAVCER